MRLMFELAEGQYLAPPPRPGAGGPESCWTALELVVERRGFREVIFVQVPPPRIAGFTYLTDEVGEYWVGLFFGLSVLAL